MSARDADDGRITGLVAGADTILVRARTCPMQKT
jgi:arginine repressor